MAKLQAPSFDLEVEKDGKTPPKPTTKSPADPRTTKGYSLAKSNHEWLSKQAAKLSYETGERHTASSVLNDIVNQFRGQ